MKKGVTTEWKHRKVRITLDNIRNKHPRGGDGVGVGANMWGNYVNKICTPKNITNFGSIVSWSALENLGKGKRKKDSKIHFKTQPTLGSYHEMSPPPQRATM